MINIDNKIYRNLEEQVRKNQKDINDLRFGLNIVGKVADYTLLPSEAKVGEAYLVGTSYPYHVWVRTEETPATWDNLGTLSSTVPGPRGEQGPKGDNGRSIENTTIDQNGYLTIWYSDGTSEQLAHRVQGAPGKVGPMGLQGPQGPQGVQGPKGNKGDQGTVFTIVGKLNGVGELPDPVTTKDTDAYLVNSGKINTQDQPIYDLYINTNKEWINCGAMTGYNTRIWKINAPEDATNGVFTPSELSNIKDRTISFIQLHNYLYSPTAENVGGFMLYKSITDDSINVLSINAASGSWSMSSTPLQLVWNVDMIPVNGIEENKLAQPVIDKLNSIETKAPQSAITEINNTLKNKADLVDGKIPIEQMPNVGSKVEFAEKDSKGNVIVDTYATKKEVSTLTDNLIATVDCSHKYEITGNTGDEHGLAIDDQQMLIKKIQGHSRRKSLNLIEYENDSGTHNGITFNVENGIITINGTATATSTVFITSKDVIPYNNMRFSCLCNKPQSGSTWQFWIGTDTPQYAIGSDGSTTTINQKNKFSVNLAIYTGTKFNNLKLYPMLVEGTFTNETMPPFQPYDNTLVNSNNVLISTGRNLVDINEYAKGRTKQGQTTNVTDYPKLTCSSTGDARLWNFKSADYYLSLPKGQYKLVIDNLTRVENYSLCNVFLPNNIIIGSSPLSVGKNVINLNLETNNTIGIMLKTPNSSFNIGLFFKDENNEYEYKQDTITTIGSLGEFDYILPQSNQKVIQTSQVVTLNGSESWSIDSNSLNKRFYYRAADTDAVDNVTTINVVSNNLKEASANDTYSLSQENNLISVASNTIHIVKRDFTTVDQLKQWLGQNPIKLVYKLATPTIINDGPIPNGMAVYNGGLQIQQGDVPYTITKQYNLSQKAQILANIEVDREQQDQLNELRSKAAATSSLGWEDVWEGTLTLNNPDFTIEQSLADKLKDKNTIYAFSFTDSSGAPEDYGSYGIVYASYQNTGSVSTLTGNGIVLQNTYEPYFIRIWLEGNTLHSRYTNSMGEGEVLLLTAIRKLTLK